MVFLHGTAIMHRNAVGSTREERVEQSRRGDESLRAYAAYVPVDGAVAKLRAWASQGAEIVYVSSHRRAENVEKDRSVLEKYGFPAGEVFFRRAGEEYKVIAERVIPDVLIE